MKYVKTVNRYISISLVTILLGACLENSTPVPPNYPSPSVLAATYVADPEYLKECVKLNPDRMQTQADYLGILPGQTTSDEVELMLGQPNDVSTLHVETWAYNGFRVGFQQNVVDTVYVDDITQFSDLKTIVMRYGCPILIFVIDRAEHPVGNYGITEFIYPDLGIDFLFIGFPVSLNEIPESMSYYRPMDLNTYLDASGKAHYQSNAGRPVPWVEAIK